MKFVAFLEHLIQYLGGARTEPPQGCKLTLDSPFWGVLWVVLLGIIVLFSGQSSRFIYIDF